MSATMQAVIENPAEYGIAFSDGIVSKGKGSDKVAVGTAPLLTVTDFQKFEAAFPGVILKHANGQSIKVHAQAITRNMLVADRTTKREKMIEAQVKGICFGQAVSVSVRIETVEKIVEVEVTVEKRAALIATLVDRGMSVADATEVANTL